MYQLVRSYNGLVRICFQKKCVKINNVHTNSLTNYFIISKTLQVDTEQKLI